MQNKLGLISRLLIGGAIALTAISPAAMAEPKPSPQLLAQNLCRAVNLATPVFKSGSTTSEALRLLEKDEEVQLQAIPPAGSQFAQITSPVTGFVQTAVMKQCGTVTPPQPDQGWQNKPTTGTACRGLVRPTVGANIRRAPTTASKYEGKDNYIATITPSRNVTVHLTTGDVVKSWRADGYDWVELDLKATLGSSYSGSGWMYNIDLKVPEVSNLVSTCF